MTETKMDFLRKIESPAQRAARSKEVLKALIWKKHDLYSQMTISMQVLKR